MRLIGLLGVVLLLSAPAHAETEPETETPPISALPDDAPEPAPAPLQTEPVEKPVPPPPAHPMGGETSPELQKRLSERRRLLTAQYTSAARKQLDHRQYEPAAQQLALAYAMDPQPERILEIAQACRRAELDAEALALYEQLLEPPLSTPQRPEMTDEIKALRAKLEDSDPDAARTLRTHMDAGKRLFQSGQHLQAAHEYALSYALKPLPRLLFNIAQAYRRAGNTLEAYLFYSRFLGEEPDSPLKKESLGYLNELRTLAFQPPIYKRRWFWGVAAAATAVLIAGGASLGVALRSKDPATDLGTYVVHIPLSF